MLYVSSVDDAGAHGSFSFRFHDREIILSIFTVDDTIFACKYDNVSATSG